MDHNGATALITGASSGLGAAFARQLAERGAHLVLVARRREKLDEIADELRSRHGVTVTVYGCDLAQPGAGAALAKQLGDDGMRVDTLINNAGVGTHGDFVAQDADAIAAQVQLNVAAVVDLTRALLPQTLHTGRGARCRQGLRAELHRGAGLREPPQQPADTRGVTRADAHPVLRCARHHPPRCRTLADTRSRCRADAAHPGPAIGVTQHHLRSAQRRADHRGPACSAARRAGRHRQSHRRLTISTERGPTMTTSLLRRNRAAQPPVAQPRFDLPEGDWQGELYPRRVPPLPRSQQRLFHRFFLAVIRRSARESYDYNCFLVLARLGKIFPIHAMLVGQLLRGGAISGPDTERIVIRIAWRMGCQYEYAHHTRMALEHGISRREIESLTHESDHEWSDRTRTLLTAADELFATKNLSEPTYQRLRRELDDNQIVEFSMLVGHYVMAAMILDVTGCEIEPAFSLDTR